MTQQYTMELADYLAIFRKRRYPFFITFFIILIVGVVVAFSLPAVYRSEATILIERQEIPQNLVATTVTGYVQERIEGIRQRLVTHEKLLEIAKSQNLYPELLEKGDISTLVSEIRENISVKMVDIKAGSSKDTATVAFTVGFEASNPKVAQSMAATLADSYLLENRQERQEQAAQVSLFLEDEVQRLRKEIVDLEQRLAKFKQEQSQQLPELLQVNMRLYEKTEGQIQESKDRILKIEDQLVALESELSLTDPRRAIKTDDGKIIQSPTERLNALTSEYLQNSARYAPNHPDMVRLSREIQVLSNQSPEASKVSELVSKLTILKSDLLKARQTYSDEHPDVLRLQKSVAVVENELRSINLSNVKDKSLIDIPADNPRYVALKTQLDTANSNLKEEQSKLKQFNEKLKEYEKRLFQTPIVERDYQSLTRDYGNAKKKYEELKNKQMEARLAQQLEAGEQGERFVLSQEAFYPTRPDKPNRIGVALLAGLLALIGGISALAVAEYRDQSVSGARGVVDAFGALPIVVIPYIENSSDFSAKRSRRLILIGLLVLIAVSIFAIVKFFLMPSTVGKA